MKLVNLTPFEVLPLPGKARPTTPSLTVIVKGTFAIVPDGICKVAAKQRPIEPDRPFLDEIGRSLAWASDAAPFKPHSDFYVLGSFHQPGGIPAPVGEAGFRFGPLSKTLTVFGPRLAVKGADGGWTVTPPEPFVTLPLRWEYSFGGLMDPRNPMGMGIDPISAKDEAPVVPLPRIEDRRCLLRSMADRPAPVNFAPVPPVFEARRRKLGTRDQRWAMFRAPLPPDDYDPSHHNAAPADQQGGNYPVGDEELTLRNLHPSRPLLATRLPGLRPVGAVLRRGEAGPAAEAMTLHLDTVVALPDENELVLVWRAVLDGTADSILRLHLEMEPLDAPPRDPSLPEAVLAAFLEEQSVSVRKDAAETAQVLGEMRRMLSKASLPPELSRVVESESDPRVVFDALTAHLSGRIDGLLRQYPVLIDRVPQLRELLAQRG